MKRFTSLFLWDIKLQAKYGFYYAAVFVTLLWITILKMLPPQSLNKALPLILFMDIIFTAFYFMAGLVFLEKVQGVLDAFALTPLKLREYLASKVLTLAAQSVFFAMIILMVIRGTDVNIPAFIAGVTMFSVICSFVGLITATYYGSFSKFLIPSMIPQIIMSIPLFFFFGIYTQWFFYILPTQPYLILVRSAFVPVQSWEAVYCVIYGFFWIFLSYKWAVKKLEQFILA